MGIHHLLGVFVLGGGFGWCGDTFPTVALPASLTRFIICRALLARSSSWMSDDETVFVWTGLPEPTILLLLLLHHHPPNLPGPFSSVIESLEVNLIPWAVFRNFSSMPFTTRPQVDEEQATGSNRLTQLPIPRTHRCLGSPSERPLHDLPIPQPLFLHSPKLRYCSR